MIYTIKHLINMIEYNLLRGIHAMKMMRFRAASTAQQVFLNIKLATFKALLQ